MYEDGAYPLPGVGIILGAKGAVVFERCEVAHVVVRDIEWGGEEFSSKVEHLVKRIGEWWGECLLVLSEKGTFRLREQVVSHDQFGDCVEELVIFRAGRMVSVSMPQCRHQLVWETHYPTSIGRVYVCLPLCANCEEISVSIHQGGVLQ